jgi:hypothetical protein
MRHQSSPTIEYKNDRIGFINGLLRLARHFIDDAFFCYWLETARIYQKIRAITNSTLAIVAVSGQAGLVGNQGIATACQSVKQGRFADIRTADNGNNRFQTY